ncbi:MAG: hypothetical protein HY819_10455 [Acidobacteria bacterium]|nr:hypothetical protein [Acidobacteriota bacterium]
MSDLLRVKKETLATRCEICHQSDLFDPIKNICLRCFETFNVDKAEKKAKVTILATERCKVFHPREIDLDNNICNHCSDLSLEATKQDISEVRPKDWLNQVNTNDANLDSYEIFKLFLFAIFCVSLVVIFIGLAVYPMAVFFSLLSLIVLVIATANLTYYIKKNH